ncbi:unnamed protein product, partial [Symbiodinium sp. KB8]
APIGLGHFGMENWGCDMRHEPSGAAAEYWETLETLDEKPPQQRMVEPSAAQGGPVRSISDLEPVRTHYPGLSGPQQEMPQAHEAFCCATAPRMDPDEMLEKLWWCWWCCCVGAGCRHFRAAPGVTFNCLCFNTYLNSTPCREKDTRFCCGTVDECCCCVCFCRGPAQQGDPRCICCGWDCCGPVGGIPLPGDSKVKKSQSRLRTIDKSLITPFIPCWCCCAGLRLRWPYSCADTYCRCCCFEYSFSTGCPELESGLCLHLVNCWCCYSLGKCPPTIRHNPICACCGCRAARESQESRGKQPRVLESNRGLNETARLCPGGAGSNVGGIAETMANAAVPMAPNYKDDVACISSDDDVEVQVVGEQPGGHLATDRFERYRLKALFLAGRQHVSSGNVAMALRLLILLETTGVDINRRDLEGRTPLHLAVRYRQGDAAELLLDAGADQTLKDFEGKPRLNRGNILGRTSEYRQRLRQEELQDSMWFAREADNSELGSFAMFDGGVSDLEEATDTEELCTSVTDWMDAVAREYREQATRSRKDTPNPFERLFRGREARFEAFRRAAASMPPTLCALSAPNGPSADESEYTTFWVMASSIAPANEAKALVRNLSMCAMLYKALKKYFVDHVVVCEGLCVNAYWPRGRHVEHIYKVCTCVNYALHAECEDVKYACALCGGATQSQHCAGNQAARSQE